MMCTVKKLTGSGDSRDMVYCSPYWWSYTVVSAFLCVERMVPFQFIMILFHSVLQHLAIACCVVLLSTYVHLSVMVSGYVISRVHECMQSIVSQQHTYHYSKLCITPMII